MWKHFDMKCTCQFLANAKKEDSHGKNNVCMMVPVDYDRTRNGTLPRCDERMLDKDVARVMGMVYAPVPDNQFAKSDCMTVDVHFSMPYSKLAEVTFGYETSQWYFWNSECQLNINVERRSCILTQQSSCRSYYQRILVNQTWWSSECYFYSTAD
jgi:hypothetical protein